MTWSIKIYFIREPRLLQEGSSRKVFRSQIGESQFKLYRKMGTMFSGLLLPGALASFLQQWGSDSLSH